MHIAWVELSRYRNYPDLSYAPGRSLNVLRGRNAQGKTNLLEALGVLLIGRSFRGARPADLAQWDGVGAHVAGDLVRAETVRPMRWEIAARDDGTWAVSGERCPWARAIAFGWPDLDLLHGPPAGRRAYLDGFATKLSPAHASNHARYRRVLVRRNMVLQDGRGDLDARLEPWDEQLVRTGLEVVERRRQVLRLVEEEAEGIHGRLGGRGALRLAYEGSFPVGDGIDGALQRLRERRPEEIRRGQTMLGPHRDDLRMDLDGRDMRVIGSRGQQRLVALALRLAEARPVERVVGSAPVLLLDDALSELDDEVRRAVLRELGGLGQVFLTTAETGLPAVHAQWWDVEDGRVSAAMPEPAWGAA